MGLVPGGLSQGVVFMVFVGRVNISNRRDYAEKSCWETLELRFPTEDLHLLTVDFRSPTVESNLLTWGLRLSTEESHLPTRELQLPSSESRLPSGNL